MSDYILRDDLILHAPLLVSPSFSKIVYLNPLTQFWRSFNNAGIYNTEVIFIGFSFPEHDEYLKIPLSRLVHNFQHFTAVDVLSKMGLRAQKLKIVDFKKTEKLRREFKAKLPGISWRKTKAIWDGFSPKTLDDIL